MDLKNLNFLANKAVDKAVFEAKIDPMKQMLIATKDLVSSEINRHAEGNENYAVIIKSYGAAKPENAEQQLEREALQNAQQNDPKLDSGIRQKDQVRKIV